MKTSILNAEADQQEQLVIRVRPQGGTYVTAMFRGVKASASAGPTQAAELFGRKFFGDRFVRVEPVEGSWSIAGQSFTVFARGPATSGSGHAGA